MMRLSTLVVAVTLGVTPVLALAAPDQMPQNRAAMPAPSDATLSDGTIGNAGAALHDVAELQRKYQGKMDSASPEQKQGLSAQANAEAVQAIESHGLSVQEYSNVIRMAQNNPQVKHRLLDAAGKNQ